MEPEATAVVQKWWWPRVARMVAVEVLKIVRNIFILKIEPIRLSVRLI